MAIERLKVRFEAEVYKFKNEPYERDGKTYDSYKVILDQDDTVHTLNIKADLYKCVPRGTQVTVLADYVTGGQGGAYISVQSIVPFGDEYIRARDAASDALGSEMIASGDLIAEAEGSEGASSSEDDKESAAVETEKPAKASRGKKGQ